MPGQSCTIGSRQPFGVGQKQVKRASWVWGLGIILGLVGGIPGAWAADNLDINFSGLNINVSTQDLESFSQTGQLPASMTAFSTFLSQADLDSLRSALQGKISISGTGISQLFGTPSGQRILDIFGKLIQQTPGQSGAAPLKTALITAANQPDGLTLLGTVAAFPGTTMTINATQAVPLINAVFDEISQTQAAIKLINQQSQASLNPVAPLPSSIPDLTAPGPADWQVKSLTLTNPIGQFQFGVNLYVPSRTNSSGSLPLVLISPGLGEDLNTYAYLAEHLASYGFAVAIVDHPGSDATRQQEFLTGKITQEVLPQEFTNRPQSLSQTLDALAKLSSVAINTKNVGIIGHSFGGYDTWALAGATYQPQTLATACQDPATIIKPSVLLECNLTKATTPLANLRDTRIQAGMAINPVGGAIYGTAGFQSIQIPMLVLAGSQDVIAPPLIEQFQPFAWLGSAQKYLVLLNGGTHMSTMGDLPPENSPNALPEVIVGQDTGVARNQLQALSVAFMQTYINQNSQYRPFLSGAYLQRLSQPAMNASLTTTLSPSQLENVIKPSK